jgi:hypothetical protein
MVELVYSELTKNIDYTPPSKKSNVETFREIYSIDEYNHLNGNVMLGDNKYDFNGNVLLYNTPLAPTVLDVYNSDLNQEITQQNYLYIVGIFSMGVLLVYAINLARN